MTTTTVRPLAVTRTEQPLADAVQPRRVLTIDPTDPAARIEWNGVARRIVRVLIERDGTASIDTVELTKRGADKVRGAVWMWLTQEGSLRRFRPELAELVQATVDAQVAEPERTPCSVQDTTAAALIPGDVVLGPDGWVIVERVQSLTADLAIRIHPQGNAAPFDRAYDATVPAQIGADTQSSASCQHYIETGRYLRQEAAPALMVECPSCGWAHSDPQSARCARCRRA